MFTSFSYILGLISDTKHSSDQLGVEALHDVGWTGYGAGVGYIVTDHFNFRWDDCLDLWGTLKVSRFFSFTLYHEPGNLVLRDSVPIKQVHSPLSVNSGGITCWVAELNTALSPDTRSKECKYSIVNFLGRNRIQTCRVYSHTLVTLCLDWSLNMKVCRIKEKKISFYIFWYTFKFVVVFCYIRYKI